MSNRINLLILTSRPDEAARLVTVLRNGGLPVHGIHTHDPQRLEELVRNPCDLMLCCTYDPQVDLDRIIAQYRRLAIDVPLVLIGEADASPEPLMQAMRSGARDLVERNNTTYLQLVVARELKDLDYRRALSEARASLERCEQRTRDLVDASTEPFAFVQQGVHVLANPAYRHLFGFAPDDDIEGTPVLDLVSPEHQGATKAFLRSQESDHGDARLRQLPLTWMHSDGSRFEAELHAAQAEIDGEPCLRLTLKTRPEPAPMAHDVDPETELPSRTALLREASKRLAAGPGVSLALLYVAMPDLGHIAQHNGLCAAYAAAAELAGTLSGLVPEGGYLTRVGDSAYAILVEVAGPQEARSMADDLSQRVRLPLGAKAGKSGAQLTIGLSVTGPGVSSASTLLDEAYGDAHRRLASAQAPVAGPVSANLRVQTPPDPSAAPAAPAVRPGHPVDRTSGPSATKPEAPPARAPASRPTPGRSQRAAEGEAERHMADLLDQALGTGPAELRLVYQPIVSLMGDSQENYSVLVRLLDAEGVLHEAKEFIGIAGARGRLGEIDRWVISHTIAELASQRANGHRCNFFVNIGEVSIQDDALLVWICDHLRDLQVRGNWLTFQFPEKDAFRNRPALARMVEGLKKIKCRVALARCGQIDDSRELMQQLQIDFLLFAHDFAQGLAEDKVKQADLVAFASLGHEYKVQSIVTGVEDPRALTVLWTAGVDFVQGNFLQTPSPTIERKG